MTAVPPPRWLLLVHQLPPRPLYLRAKIRRRLLRVGAIPVKNSVYVLPDRDECLEDFQWIAQEAVAGGGEAFVCRVELVSGLAGEALVDRFRADAAARYEPVTTALEARLGRHRSARGRSPGAPAAADAALRRQVDEIRRLDFFPSTHSQQLEALMAALDVTTHPPRRARAVLSPRAYKGRVWVTRLDPHVDRLASAWLIRRFIDPAARFRFVPPAGGGVRADEISFDMVDATFGHDGDRCTFETLVARFGLTNRGLRRLGEIVHDVDLKDGRFGHAETPGIERLVKGLSDAHADSAARVAAALPLFDALFASFGGTLDAPRRQSRKRR